MHIRFVTDSLQRRITGHLNHGGVIRYAVGRLALTFGILTDTLEYFLQETGLLADEIVCSSGPKIAWLAGPKVSKMACPAREQD